MRPTRLSLAAPLALSLVLLTGCADDGGSDTDAVSPASAAASSAPSAEEGPVVVAVAEDDGKDALSAEVRVGQLVQLDLATCGGCGFAWNVTTAPDPAVAVEETVPEPTAEAAASDPSSPPLVGAPTTTRLAFRGAGAGTTKVSVGYQPPGGGAAERTVVLTITVR